MNRHVTHLDYLTQRFASVIFGARRTKTTPAPFYMYSCLVHHRPLHGQREKMLPAERERAFPGPCLDWTKERWNRNQRRPKTGNDAAKQGTRRSWTL